MTTSTEAVELVAVTGASTGIGAATARELAARGFHVLAGVRRDADAAALRAERIEPHRLDITNDADVAAIAERVARDPARRSRHCRCPSGAGSSRSTCSATSR